MADLGVQPHIIEAVLFHRLSGHKAGVTGIYNRSSLRSRKTGSAYTQVGRAHQAGFAQADERQRCEAQARAVNDGESSANDAPDAS